MRLLTVFIFLFGAIETHSAVLVEDKALIQKINQQLKQYPIVSDKFPRKEKNYQELGQPLTPFFSVNNGYGVYLKHNQKCYFVRIMASQSHTYKKVSCDISHLKIESKDMPGFFLIKPREWPTENNQNSYLVKNEVVEYVGKRFAHVKRHFDEAQIIEPSHVMPSHPFVINAKNQVQAITSDKGIGLISRVNITTTHNSWDEERELILSRNLDFQIKQDYIFSNGNGVFFLKKNMNNFLASSDIVVLNPNYLKSNLKNSLFFFKQENYCFRDDLVEPSVYDCYYLFFEKLKPLVNRHIQGIIWNTNDDSIKVI
ncbi:MAG: hypothetical protein JNM93_11800 [Bacteriovoracaceae bacterium]|nr:hypothetical protein [Bacteriovoracaceae bacterium]